MGQFRGRNGRVYALGQPHEFTNVPLQARMGGWDWQAPEDLRFWLPDCLSFDFGGDLVGVSEIHHYSGWVSLSRCLSGPVSASGAGRTTSLLGIGAWILEIQTVVADSSILGHEVYTNRGKTMGGIAAIEITLEEPINDEVLVVLPFVGERAFVGVGEQVGHNQVEVKLEPERIEYGYC